jgi:flagellar hook capping protein FlgD
MPPLATHRSSLASRAPFPVALLVLILTAPLAHGAATLGFLEKWSGTSLAGWTGGAAYSNPGTGGVGGAGDGYLLMSTPGPFGSSLGAMSTAAQYTGNWQAAGITQVRFWLNDVGADDPLEIHFALGNSPGGTGNFWQYNTGFIPPLHAWAPFTVDLTSSAAFTHIIDSPPGGTFAQALQNVNRVLIRHDHAPYVQSPDALDGDVGVDGLLLTNGIVDVPPGEATVAGPIQLAMPYPNPSWGAVAMSLRTFEEAPITIQIVDVTGRIVRQAMLAAAPAGPRTWAWDGATDSGESAPAGYYRVRAFGPSGGTSRPLIRLPGAR